jgi:hypothetical protein
MKSKLKITIVAILIVVVLGFLLRDELHLPALTGKATLSWQADGSQSVSEYKIYYGTQPRNDGCPPGGYSENVKIGNKTNYTIENLPSGKTYYFSVTALNASGKESCFSPETTKKITFSFFSWIKNLWPKK